MLILILYKTNKQNNTKYSNNYDLVIIHKMKQFSLKIYIYLIHIENSNEMKMNKLRENRVLDIE